MAFYDERGTRHPDVGDRDPVLYDDLRDRAYNADGTPLYPVTPPAGRVNRPYSREVGGFELDKADLVGHPAECPDSVMERLRTAAIKLGLSIQVGAKKATATGGRPRDGTWERYIEVTDERLPVPFRVQVTRLEYDEEWANAARRIGLWPTR